MSMFESIMVALDNLRVNKLRSFLTMIGIVFGVMAVVTVVSIGQAGQASVLSELSNYKDGFFILYKSVGDGNAKAEIRMRDLSEARKLEGVKYVSSTNSYQMSEMRGKEKLQFIISATTSDMVKMQKVDFVAGRFFNAQEQRARQKVIVVEAAYAEKVYGTAERAINRKVKLSGGSFRIIGVYAPQKSIFGGVGGTQYKAYTPMDSMPDTGTGTGRYLSTLEFLAETPEGMDETIQELKEWLAVRHNAETDDFKSQTGKEVQEQVSSIFSMLQLVIGSIAGISLLVGGIGIMNIMLVSVTERTREIGIRKAIGATPRAIKQQFLIESVILSFLGGTVGAVLGLLVGALASLVLSLPNVVSIWAIVLAFGFSATVGIFFGYYPANKAAKLQPIEALRYE
ncbi:ABC transporter permease [Paenibacillus oenotherae]|uniref:ABC transporter permease n=1 Tax=Paenibacillus oenotherae TaxID=1435645 RepID=A0ABS7D1U9_9BACL|nr:ABC transporter permease [Paenibacillus oenotherae]MBW7473814.1 ABC transporter permease [Paenibacillus oenotherae]